jgi:hypothetical protein
MKILPVGAELFYIERQTDELTDTTKLIAAFISFAIAPNVQPFNTV